MDKVIKDKKVQQVAAEVLVIKDKKVAKVKKDKLV